MLFGSYFVEQLDPAHLDRFTFQVKVEGLIASLKRTPSSAGALADKPYLAAIDVVRRFGGLESRAAAEAASLSPPTAKGQHAAAADNMKAGLAVGWELLDQVTLGPTEPLLLELLRVLVTDHGCDASNSLLSDRTFLSRAPTALRATALLADPPRHYCIPSDLHTVSLLTTCRVPPLLARKIPSIIDEVISRTETLYTPAPRNKSAEQPEDVTGTPPRSTPPPPPPPPMPPPKQSSPQMNQETSDSNVTKPRNLKNQSQTSQPQQAQQQQQQQQAEQQGVQAAPAQQKYVSKHAKKRLHQ
eukprot:SAG31_NODE_10_length_40133_cov_27.863041_34_plen_300_part_00